jgi:Concanavalin A-like lectin/glucanases superfamily
MRSLAFVALAACSSASEKPGVDPPVACEGETGPTGAVVLDGKDDYATTGKKAELGLAQFTIEAWVRRDGAGITATSGAGGLSLVPIAAKGLGEGDGSNIDCNYLFGFAGDVLGADFEDMATGANHPVYGTTAVPRGEWHHVAVTYDGATWHLYVDGKPDGEAKANATPRADSVHAFALGTALASDGIAHGFLHGALDEVRVWSLARTPEEIADGMNRTLTTGEGLVVRFGLDVGVEPGLELAGGATLVDDHVVLDQGAPPMVGAISPADGDKVDVSVELDLGVELSSPRPVDVTYHVREVTSADDFTVVVMPDTQIYTLEGRNLEKYFNDQTKWIRAHRADYNIVGVIHNGDIINNEPLIYQWNVADKAMKTLETPEQGLIDGMPYGVGVGNHDNKLVGENTVLDTTRFNQFFGVARFAGKSYYGGHHGAKNDDSWFTFTAGGMDFVVVNLMYDLDPDPAVIAWAKTIFEMHPDAYGILNTHYLLGAAGTFGPQARMIYTALKGVPNVHLMTGGHVAAESRRFDTFEGHTVHSMLADYQGRVDGGQGYMRLWEFSPSTQTLSVKTYSPTLDKFEADADSEFTLKVDLKGIGGPFRDVFVKGAPSDALASTIEGLEPGKTYEWYADVDSCGKRVSTRIARFTTNEGSARQSAPHISRQRTERVGSGAVSSYADDPALAD